MKRDQTYQVVSRSAVMVEFANGNVVSYPPGLMFQADPTNASVTRLLRSNLIRTVTPREVPNFKVDVKSSTERAVPVSPPLSPLQATLKKATKNSKPEGRE